jgi:DNA-directed RNA polymerase specialized sigma24 family protein
VERLDSAQLAIWISAAPDPQRSALALFYLDEFDYAEILDIAELKLGELSRFLAQGRRQLQAWLDARFAESHPI